MIEIVRVSRTITKDITRCFYSCPYYSLEMNVMVCEHPQAPDMGYIITQENRNRFPPKCPINPNKR